MAARGQRRDLVGAARLHYHPPRTNCLFHTVPVRPEAWLYLIAIGLFTFAAVELEKWLRFRKPAPRNT